MKYTYETTDNSSYVVATFSDGEKTDSNQLDILVNNEFKNIIKPSCRYVGDDVLISYNITSKISLEHACSNRKITKNGFINIIEGALSALEDIEKYGLFDSGIVFDEKNVYVKAGTYEPSFIYLPCATQDVGIECVKNFVLSLVMGSKIERINDGFIQDLFDILNNPDLCADDLHAFCDEQTKGKKSAAKFAKNARFSVITPTMIDSDGEILRSICQKDGEASSDMKKTLPDNNPPKKQERETPKKRKPKKHIFFILQLVVAGIITLISTSGFFNNADGTLNVKYLLGIILAVFVADIVIYRELFMNEKSVGDEEGEAQMSSSDCASAKEMPDSSESQTAASSIQGVSQSLEQIYSGVQGSEFEDTVLLRDENRCAHLEFFDNGVFKRINLDKEVVTVGKLSKQCDYAIGNNKISKIHAEFIVRDNKFFVKDCNSTNGTYINGSTQRIASNVEYQIYDGYCITLANVDMTLKFW